MKEGLSIWDKLTRVVIALLILAAGLAVVSWYKPKIEENQRLRLRKLELEAQIDQQLERGKRLDAKINAMQFPRTIERMARERLTYAKPGETIIHFDTPPASNSISTPN
jgi:cell division protein FtsB